MSNGAHGHANTASAHSALSARWLCRRCAWTKCGRRAKRQSAKRESPPGYWHPACARPCASAVPCSAVPGQRRGGGGALGLCLHATKVLGDQLRYLVRIRSRPGLCIVRPVPGSRPTPRPSASMPWPCQNGAPSTPKRHRMRAANTGRLLLPVAIRYARSDGRGVFNTDDLKSCAR
jgi:hypothetical protein